MSRTISDYKMPSVLIPQSKPNCSVCLYSYQPWLNLIVQTKKNPI